MADVGEFSRDRFAQDPIICDCHNVCNRDSGRGACVCLQAGRNCSKYCTCGTKKLECRNRTTKRRGYASPSESSSDEAPVVSFIDEDDDDDDEEADSNTPSARPSAKSKAKHSKKGSVKRGKTSVSTKQTTDDEAQQEAMNLPIEDDLLTSYIDEGDDGQGDDMSVPDSPPPAEEVGNITVDIEAFLQTKDEMQLRTLCLQLLRMHPEDVQGVIEEQGDQGEREDAEDILDWCRCGHCREMPTETESVCCRRRHGPCITARPNFSTLIVDPDALDIAMAQRRDLLQLGDRPGNNQYRHAAYKSYIYWKFGPTGRYNRVVIPSCAVWKIRDRHPSEDGHYTGFRMNRF